MNFKLLIVSSLLISMFSCHSEKTAEDVLTDFVEYRFESKQTKDEMIDFLTEELLETVKNISDDDFNKMVDVKNYKMKNFNIDHKACGEDLCNLTYTLKYDVMSDGKKSVLAEVKKIATVKKTSKGWKVAGIENVKTFYDNQEEITP